MKKIVFFVFVIFLGISVNFVFAAALRPFGGIVLTAPTPGIECPASYFDDGFFDAPTDPYTIKPAGISPPGPFTGILSPLPQFGQIVPGAFILGLYLPTPISDCVTETPPPAPIPIFKAVLWGTSVPSID